MIFSKIHFGLKNQKRYAFIVVVKFSPSPEFDLSKKFILVKALPNRTCSTKFCEMPLLVNIKNALSRLKSI